MITCSILPWSLEVFQLLISFNLEARVLALPRTRMSMGTREYTLKIVFKFSEVIAKTLVLKLMTSVNNMRYDNDAVLLVKIQEDLQAFMNKIVTRSEENLKN